MASPGPCCLPLALRGPLPAFGNARISLHLTRLAGTKAVAFQWLLVASWWVNPQHPTMPGLVGILMGTGPQLRSQGADPLLKAEAHVWRIFAVWPVETPLCSHSMQPLEGAVPWEQQEGSCAFK